MATIAELIGTDRLVEIYEPAREAMELILAENKPRHFGVPVRTGEAVGEPILRAAVAGLMSTAHPDPNLPHPYTHYTKTSLSSVLRDISNHTLGTRESGTMALSIIGTLQRYKLARNVRGTGRDGWMVRAWPHGLVVDEWTAERTGLSVDERNILENRIQEEAEKTKLTTVTKVDIRIIPKPDPNPESILHYVRKIVDAYHRLEELYDDTCGELEDSLKRIAALENQLNHATWDTTVDQLAAMVHELG